MHDTIALVHGTNEHGIEVDRPDAVVGFLKPDGLVDEITVAQRRIDARQAEFDVIR